MRKNFQVFICILFKILIKIIILYTLKFRTNLLNKLFKNVILVIIIVKDIKIN